MAEREPISKKLRFEVFKRDKFACQYCGKKAPEVVLECDHIQPVADGGVSEILNLVTACKDCNGGKGARLLSDQTVLEKQRAQIEELEERRQQLEMMLEWRNELSSLDEDMIDRVADYIRDKSGFGPNKIGRASLKKWLKKYTFEQLSSAIEESADVYLRYIKDEATDASWEMFFKKIPVFAGINRDSEKKPYLRDLFYMRGIVRRRVDNKWYDCLTLLENTHLAGASIDSLREFCKVVDSIEQFERECEAFISRDRSKGDDPDA